MDWMDLLPDCPHCGAPAEPIAWHEASSLLRAGQARLQCLVGHWSLAS
ncbi:hypothetical protein [Sporichthya sp.]|nr:hypothetical protein [Sporichthya sp.]MBA3741562.1 hypothetical protein [Sporichthya sp.]